MSESNCAAASATQNEQPWNGSPKAVLPTAGVNPTALQLGQPPDDGTIEASAHACSIASFSGADISPGTGGRAGSSLKPLNIHRTPFPISYLLTRHCHHASGRDRLQLHRSRPLVRP